MSHARLNPARRTILAACASLSLAATLLIPSANAEHATAPSGIDVASWQGAIDWHGVAGAEQKFAFVKATEGLDYTNPQYHADITAADASGLTTGSYHYGRPNTDPIAQARHYAAAYKAHPQDLPPVLDIEQTDGVGVGELQNWTRDFLGEVERQTGRKPMVYTYRYFWEQDMGNTTEFAHYPLWFAAYQSEVPTQLPGGWQQMAFWQRTGEGRVTGINTPVDMNLFNGTPGQLPSFNGYGGVLVPGEKVATDHGMGTSARDIALALLGLAGAIGIMPPEVAGNVANQAALAAGVDSLVAGALGGQVAGLGGKLPVAELNRIVQGNYSIGDLLLLLNAAGHRTEG
ncbi:glycoside hydrolase family 25 protein [Corynebacterium epidermidicanis]|uniref:Lysozyme M1 (1,4-beta-N-acetylmuramidase) n=1 Tax=Corynebacterium epidermidicanis TaxID=1050174 RepID=A0A0G3GTA4_9CORY|nr:glycoside hydrolase family 25 protein [Corynebacterium epidermidicanis]AKK02087.1 lysozyme M1 (1,4-beta-N-acetylmuramidase) [Corynebacterium epidermidicanis]